MVDERNEEESSFQKVGECLYRYLPNNRYYARIKNDGKEIRRSLKATDRKHAERKLRDLEEPGEKSPGSFPYLIGIGKTSQEVIPKKMSFILLAD